VLDEYSIRLYTQSLSGKWYEAKVAFMPPTQCASHLYVITWFATSPRVTSDLQGFSGAQVTSRRKSDRRDQNLEAEQPIRIILSLTKLNFDLRDLEIYRIKRYQSWAFGWVVRLDVGNTMTSAVGDTYLASIVYGGIARHPLLTSSRIYY
jgi:hypothetical protein